MLNLINENKVMNYEKKYKEANDKVAARFGTNVAKEIFTDLYESEDERIRKVLVELVKCNERCGYFMINNITTSAMLAWLEKQGKHTNFRNKIQIGDKVTRNEDGILVNLSQLNRVAKKDKKQGEQKPAWSEEDEKTLNEIFSVAARASLRKSTLFGKSYDYIKWQNWLKSLKDRIQPKVELTQLDKNILEAAIAFVEQNNHFNYWRGVDKHTVLSALYSLRPQNTWKPSDEQMRALHDLNITGNISYAGQGQVLIGLYNDLKKLKGE